MAGRRLLYLTALVGCVVFYFAYRGWLSFLLLLTVVLLPGLSVLLSLPAMLTCAVTVSCPSRLTVGEQAEVSCEGESVLPMMGVSSALEVCNGLTDQRWNLASGKALPAEHCGALTVRTRKVWTRDYLGLLRLPLVKKQSMTVLVCPKPVPVEPLPDTNRYLANSFRPKPGGGFSEHHELRLYRPGDNLRQVHWKLSVKTGKLIFREAQEPLRGAAALTAVLRGTPAQLDALLGKLLFMSRHLCKKEIIHEIRCLTGKGMERFTVATEEQAQAAVDALLQSKQAPAGSVPEFGAAAWRCHIGGGDRG